jgi:hypothetical protein
MGMVKQFIGIAAALGLILAAVAPSAAAQRNQAAGSTSVRTTTGSGMNTDRGPNFRPHGWSEGKKKGWGCTPGTRNCKPPGLR